jgi:hypothetical protein
VGTEADPSPVAHILPSSKAYAQIIALLDQAQSHPPGGCRCAGAAVGPVIPLLVLPLLRPPPVCRGGARGPRRSTRGRYCSDRTRPETRWCLVGKNFMTTGKDLEYSLEPFWFMARQSYACIVIKKGITELSTWRELRPYRANPDHPHHPTPKGCHPVSRPSETLSPRWNLRPGHPDPAGLPTRLAV